MLRRFTTTTGAQAVPREARVPRALPPRPYRPPREESDRDPPAPPPTRPQVPPDLRPPGGPSAPQCERDDRNPGDRGPHPGDRPRRGGAGGRRQRLRQPGRGGEVPPRGV